MSLVPQREARPAAPSQGGPALVGVVELGLNATSPRELSFVAVYEALFPRLCAFAERFLPADDADDVVQEAMADIWARWDYLSIEGGRPDVPFFFRAVRNQIAVHRRHSHRELSRLGLYLTQLGRRKRLENAADAELDRAELAAIVDATVAGLPERCREAWLLLRENEFTYKQAAEAMDVAIDTAKKQMTKATRLVREAVTDAGYGEAARAAGRQLPPTSGSEA